jgi:hypothetical protein
VYLGHGSEGWGAQERGASTCLASGEGLVLLPGVAEGTTW